MCEAYRKAAVIQTKKALPEWNSLLKVGVININDQCTVSGNSHHEVADLEPFITSVGIERFRCRECKYLVPLCIYQYEAAKKLTQGSITIWYRLHRWVKS